MKVVAEFMHSALRARADAAKLKEIKGKVVEFCKRFEFYK